MSNFILIIFCLLAGILSRKLSWVGKDGYKSLNTWVLYFGLPALSFRFLPQLRWNDQLLFTMVVPVIVLAGSTLFFYLLGLFFKMSNRTSRTLMLVGGLSNTSFVGFPLIQAYYGSQALPIGIVSDQMTFFLLSTAGVMIAMNGSLSRRKKTDLRYVWQRVFSFPPLIGCLLALTLPRLFDLSPLDNFLGTIASTVSPLALFSIGLQLNFCIVKTEIPTIAYAALYKLLIAPAVIAILALALELKGEIIRVSLFEMAMPSLVATSMVLHEFRLNTKLGNSVIGLTIPLGLLSTYMWFLLFGTF